MTTESTFILLFVVATAVAIVGRRWHLPYTVGLVLAGFVLGFVHVLPAPGLTKSLLFAVFLPGLLFEAAFHLDYSDFSRNRMAIVSLAVPGVIGAMVATAAILAPVARTLDIAPDFDWRYALVFGGAHRRDRPHCGRGSVPNASRAQAAFRARRGREPVQ